MIPSYDYNLPKLDKRKTVKYKCRACKREFTMSNRIPGMCPHCNSNQIHEAK